MQRVMRGLGLVLAIAGPAFVYGQWKGVKQLGQGGEPTVSVDGKGTVYVTSHLPTQVFVSRDWGASYELRQTFKESLGDMIGVPLDDSGGFLGVFMPPQINGLMTRLSGDYGKTYQAGAGITGRSLDREWAAVTADGTVLMVYSDGYIGGPDSKGIFISESQDRGLTWKELGRVDVGKDGVYAVDPHIAILGDGTVAVYWAVSLDKNTLVRHEVAVSRDGGKTFGKATEISSLKSELGDTQERWMLGGLAAHGQSTLSVFFLDYALVKEIPMLRMFVRTSTDSGKTFGEAVPVSSDEELAGVIRPGFVQSTSWATYDRKGRLHCVWYDNRAGTKKVGNSDLGVWQLRHSVIGETSTGVGNTFAAVRPPMDFISCIADEKFLHVAWVETPDMVRDWQFTGQLWTVRKPL